MLDSSPGDGGWSAEVGGLSGRLRVRLEDLRPGLRHAVYLELRNHGPDPVAMTNRPRIDAELSTRSGDPVATAVITASGPLAAPQPAVIPSGACLAFRVDIQTVGTPTREQGAALLAIGDKGWFLASGYYVLTATIVYPEPEAGDANGCWAGRLDLPPVEFEVRLG